MVFLFDDENVSNDDNVSNYNNVRNDNNGNNASNRFSYRAKAFLTSSRSSK